MPNLVTYLVLGAAIVCEVFATSALARSDGFTRLWPSVLAMAGYALAIYLLALTMRVMPAGIVYAIWSGVGIVLISAVAWLRLGQKLDLPAVIGLGFIIAGVMTVNLFSKTTGH
jgi:small multidrug resistance pump